MATNITILHLVALSGVLSTLQVWQEKRTTFYTPLFQRSYELKKY